MAVTIGPGKDYTTLQAWADAIQATTESDHDAVCYAGDLGGLSVGNTGGLAITVDNGSRHTGQDAGNSGVAYCSGDWLIQDTEPQSITVDGLRFHEATVTLITNKSIDFQMERCLFAYAVTDVPYAVLYAAVASQDDVDIQGDLINCAVYKSAGIGGNFYFYTEEQSTGAINVNVDVHNCTIIDDANISNTGILWEEVSGTLGGSVKNTIVGGTANDFAAIGSPTVAYSNNISADGTASGPGSQTSVTMSTVVENVATDFTPKFTGAAYNTGTSSVIPGIDIIGTVRPQNGVYDVGAFELIFALPGGSGIGRLIKPSRVWNG